MLWTIILTIIVGLVVGALGRLVVPGKQNISIWVTLLVGVVAAFIGMFIAQALGLASGPGFHVWQLVIQVVLAAIGVALVAGTMGRRSVRR